MALPRPLIPTLVALTTLTAAGPAEAAKPSPLRTLASDALFGTAKKNLDPKTSLIGPDLKTTLRNVQNAVAPVADPACAAAPVSHPFAPWGDHANYVPAPDSGFEGGLGSWTATGPVTIASDNEPWKVSGNTSDASSAVIPAGSSIASASFCGGLAYPTIRFFARSTTSAPAKALVTIRYTGRDSVLAALPLGVITAGERWQPTTATLTASGVPLFTGTRLGLTITALSGTVAVDDVYVDPYRRS